MLFTSAKFIAFLIALVFLYYLVPKKAQWPLLLIGSYAFYYFADTSGMYLIFIITTTISAYFAGIMMNKVNDKSSAYLKANKETLSKEDKKAYKAKMKSKKWAILLVCLIFNIGILSVTKYTNFVINNINTFLSDASKLQPIAMIVPMGISFYTFQTCGYIIDVYRGKHDAQHNPFKLALFVSFFPQLVQGPISRYSDMEASLYKEHKLNESDISEGLTRILWGYFKKLVVADRIITAVTTLISDTAYSGTFVFVAMLFYAFELYCDFTGGIDITIGIARILGITLKENFNLPYFSKNIKEYWNRWHITMGTWFTDYIFYPISVSGPMLKLSKWSREHLGQNIGKRVSVYLSSLIVWFTTGLWHGAAWNFIVWGLMNFVVIMISQELEPLYAKFHGKFKVKDKAWYGVFEIVRTIFLMSMIRMFDCYRDVPLTFKMVGTMFTRVNLKIFVDGSLLNLGITKADYIILVVAFIIILSVSIIKYNRGFVFNKDKYLLRYSLLAVLFVLIIVFGAYGVGYDSTQFIYNQF